MSIQKTIVMFAVLCLIALELGYWVGLPREIKEFPKPDWDKPKHEVLAVENGEKFSVSVGDRLSFDFKDGTCNDGYRFILLESHREESNNSGNSLRLISMLDRYWGPWLEGKTNSIALERNNAYGGQAWNNIYIPFAGSEMKTPPLFRQPGWHSAELCFFIDFLELKIDDRLIGSMTNPPAAFNAAINSKAKISIMSAPSNTSAYPTVETAIKNITIRKIK